MAAAPKDSAMRGMRIGIGSTLCAVVLLAQLPGAPPVDSAPRLRFSEPLKLTPDTFGGYEPGIAIDRFDNIYVTAHKDDYASALSADPNGSAPVRSASWLWTSSDGGRTFHDMPGTSQLGEYRFEPGVEGDVALDQAGHVYFVDTNVTDVTFARWLATGRGKLELQTTRPALGSGELVDDRPWIISHGNGVVMYLGNDVESDTSVGDKSGGAYGAGQYTIYMSYDGGNTFDTLGKSLADSGWCRPGADPRQGSGLLYVICTSNGTGRVGHLWAFVSRDNGRSWNRYEMGHYNNSDSTQSWPSVAVANDGTVYALYNNADTNGSSPDPIANHLMLYTSKTEGRTWSARDVTPTPGLIHYSWIAVAPNGTLGIAYYRRPDADHAWYLYAGTAEPGEPFHVVSVAPRAPVSKASSFRPHGDFFEIAFDSHNKLDVVWTSDADVARGASTPLYGLPSDVYFARQL